MTSPSTSRTARVTPWPGIALLLAIASGGTAAAELYRWTEADGAITFSPQRPPAGTDFERVDDGGPTPSAGRPAPEQPAPRPDAVASPPEGTVTPSAVPRSPRRDPDAGPAYAPLPPLGAAAAAPARPDPAPLPATGRAGRDRTAQQRIGSSQREERCRELEKRVVSLERRLATRLSARDMDDTVMYMARYQQNVERHCRD